MWGARYLHFLGGALEAVPEERRRLGVLIGVALAGHVAAFAFFRVATPAVVPPAASRVGIALYQEPVVAPDGSEGRSSVARSQTAYWSRINDPSLLIFPPGFLASGEADPLQPGPLWAGDAPGGSSPLVALSSDLNPLPDALPPLPRLAAQALSVASASPQLPNLRVALLRPALAKTTVLWDGPAAFAARVPAAWTLPDAPASVLAESRPTFLRLAVDGEGRVVHAVVDQSSGRSEVDLVAIDGARRLRFKPDPATPLLWGRAAVYWQYVAAAQAPAPAPKPSGGTP